MYVFVSAAAGFWDLAPGTPSMRLPGFFFSGHVPLHTCVVSGAATPGTPPPAAGQMPDVTHESGTWSWPSTLELPCTCTCPRTVSAPRMLKFGYASRYIAFTLWCDASVPAGPAYPSDDTQNV